MDEEKIIAENIAEAESMLADAWLLRHVQLRELTGLLLKEDAQPEQITEGYRTLASALEQSGGDGADFIKALRPELDLHSRLSLAREWAENTDPMPLEDILPSGESGYTIAHFGNLYADSALAAFSEALGTASALPAEDYVAACEEVSDGSADFCILPIESARDGVMDRFEQMIDRYSLFVLMICTVHLSEDEWILYALLAAAPCRLSGEERAADCIRIRITPEREALWEVLLAADQLGARLLECRQSREDDDRGASYRLTFSADEKCRAALIAYLELGYSGYLLIGAYRRLPDASLEAKG